MTNRSVLNRPFKFGERDRREFIVEDSEVSLVAINDDGGNPTLLGRAKAGTPLDEAKWQIRQITYDDQGGVLRVLWAVNDDGEASTDYEFIWDSTVSLTITGITNAATAVVTVSDAETLENGSQIIIKSVSGMTEVNYDGSNVYTVANLVGNTFELQGINSTTYGVYGGGGTVSYAEAINYDYA